MGLARSGSVIPIRLILQLHDRTALRDCRRRRRDWIDDLTAVDVVTWDAGSKQATLRDVSNESASRSNPCWSLIKTAGRCRRHGLETGSRDFSLVKKLMSEVNQLLICFLTLIGKP